MMEFVQYNIWWIWLLCSLCTFLMISTSSRFIGYPVEKWKDRHLWNTIIFCCIFFPYGITCALFIFAVGICSNHPDVLTKERHIFKKEKIKW